VGKISRSVIAIGFERKLKVDKQEDHKFGCQLVFGGSWVWLEDEESRVRCSWEVACGYLCEWKGVLRWMDVALFCFLYA
jgi:hypothetical protein